ncbi:sigma E protease regulator RseP [Marinobacterium arenosum]|uniref:sigma E protease regulator RseP n=1 Tax=Marinobacterium arenosum TaxID=2862496 RepID=UPI001C95F2F1|nr:sigma E protease regulator RseP [Marinobacterium arenosum]MBY4675649.1 sigma E protease regulator RseP [Marinobacterium arenosum]
MFDLLQTILATLVTLGLLVTIHEWGHFWVARRCGVRVLRFSVGFGKPLYTRKDRHGTEFVVAAVPLGGYVRMLDEREGPVPADLRDQAFNTKPLWQRTAVVAAGPLVNLLFAVLAYWLMFVVGVTVLRPVIGELTPGSPAAEAQLPTGYEVVALNGRQTDSWDELNLRLAAWIGESGRVELDLRHSERQELRRVSVSLHEWQVDVETESPLSAFGIVPWRPPVPPVIGQLLPDGRAVGAGLQLGDRVLSIDGLPVASWQQLVEMVQAAPDRELLFDVERQGRVLSIAVLPAVRVAEDGREIGYVGAGVQPVSWPDSMYAERQLGLVDGLLAGLVKTGQMISLILESIWKMIEGVISVKNLSGPITIAKVAGASAASGLEAFVGFLAYLSISLGVLNLLPIPMLDGGHLFYYLIEAVRGKPVGERVQMMGLKIGMAILFSLMAVAIFNDVARL